MSDTCPVVRIADDKAPGGFVEINESDFNADVHSVYVEADERPLAEMSVKELKALAAARNVDLGDATKKDDIVAALELAAEAASPEPEA